MFLQQLKHKCSYSWTRECSAWFSCSTTRSVASETQLGGFPGGSLGSSEKQLLLACKRKH